MHISSEILCEILAFSTQLSLANFSTVNRRFHNVIKHHFSCLPLHMLRPVDVEKDLSCTLGIGSIKMNIKQAMKIFRPKFVRSPIVYLYLPAEEKKAAKYLEWFQSTAHLWSDQLLILYLTGPISDKIQRSIFTNFAGSAKEFTVEGYSHNLSVNLAYPDFAICPTVWICGRIEIHPSQIIEHLRKFDNQLRLSLDIDNKRELEKLVDAIQKDFYGSVKAHSFFLEAEYYITVLSASADRETRAFNGNTLESLHIRQKYSGYGLIELQCSREFCGYWVKYR